MVRTLRNHLLAWSMGTLLIVWAAFVVLAYRVGQEEADEITHGHLVTVASLLSGPNATLGTARSLLPVPAASGRQPLKAHDYQQSLSVVTWDPQGALVHRAGSGPLPPFDRSEGFALLQLGEPPEPWRSFSRWSESGDRKILVMVSEEERDALAEDMAQEISLPGWWLLPVMLLALGWAVSRGLRPLRQLSIEIGRLEILNPQPLAARPRHEELRAAVDAINLLVSRYHAALNRERRLSDAFAHELRTPLTALNLQVHYLRSTGAGGDDAVLEAIEREARRANEVLGRLLSLARASRAEMSEAATEVDVVPIARQLLADHAPSAHAAGNELALSGDEVFVVKGHATLIEVALRNLIENALVHAPRHSQVEVQVNRAGAWIQVCDGPSGLPGTSGDRIGGASAPHASPALGLGMGHEVVTRVADMHGGRFEQVAPPGGFRRCYRISFGMRGAPSAPAAPC